jgi:hypothetical protein
METSNNIDLSTFFYEGHFTMPLLSRSYGSNPFLLGAVGNPRPPSNLVRFLFILSDIEKVSTLVKQLCR